MAMDLMDVKKWEVFQFVTFLAIEARVCLTGDEFQPVEIRKASYNIDTGLLVTDREGKTFRLQVTAEEQK